MSWELPALPDQGLLADLCREAASRERVQPILVEKDFHLTRLLCSLDRRFGAKLLLKGGTLLSKVDLGFLRMSEDADLVVPGEASRHGRENAARLKPLGTALLEVAPELGATVRFPAGELAEKSSHGHWQIDYASQLGDQRLLLEVAIRPVLRSPRRVALRQLLQDPLLGDYAGATCHALAADEARAEKVRAAFTREEGRDYYDLLRLLEAGADLSSGGFIALVGSKLAELGFAPLGSQGPRFALDDRRLASLRASLRRDLPSVLREDAPAFELEGMLSRFAVLWPHDSSQVGQRRLPGVRPAGR